MISVRLFAGNIPFFYKLMHITLILRHIYWGDIMKEKRWTAKRGSKGTANSC